MDKKIRNETKMFHDDSSHPFAIKKIVDAIMYSVNWLDETMKKSEIITNTTMHTSRIGEIFQLHC